MDARCKMQTQLCILNLAWSFLSVTYLSLLPLTYHFSNNSVFDICEYDILWYSTAINFLICVSGITYIQLGKQHFGTPCICLLLYLVVLFRFCLIDLVHIVEIIPISFLWRHCEIHFLIQYPNIILIQPSFCLFLWHIYCCNTWTYIYIYHIILCIIWIQFTIMPFDVSGFGNYRRVGFAP